MKQAAIITTLLIAAVVTTMTASANSPVASKATAKRNTVQRIRSKDDTWSIPVTSNILSSDTAMHQKPGRNSEMTYGAFDISAPVGTPVFAPCEGEVVHASKANEAGYGHNVRIRCSATGLEIWIAHLKALWAKKGQEVAEHTQVGTVGRTGITSFNHVHITLRGKGASEIEEHFDLSLFHWSPFHSPSNIGDYEWDGRYTNAKDPLDAIFGAEDGEQQAGNGPRRGAAGKGGPEWGTVAKRRAGMEDCNAAKAVELIDRSRQSETIGDKTHPARTKCYKHLTEMWQRL